ncbi:hypothetical protein [Bordetella genomosp. 13]|uniref:hypothetical protein n=1 Tax=Bordetella genomosp. 13 TaxID=463040 RepID=UPI0011A7B389|nr:hypothetical protein [Bordetella genomosp. 13]
MMNKKLAATLLFPLFLAACGGGGGDDDDEQTPPPETPTTPENPPPPVDAVTQASLDTAARLGLAPIAGNAGNVRVYDVVADIGDTWRLTLDMGTGAYGLKVLHTVYGLTDTSGTFTQSTNGSFITLTGASGAFTLLIDERTRTIAGAMALGGKTATVSGTSYTVPADVSVLAGTYSMLIAAHNIPPEPQPGEEPEETYHQLLPGAVMLRADGSAVICPESYSVNAEGLCTTPFDDDTYPGLTGKLAIDAADGEYHLRAKYEDEEEAIDFGILRVQAGDFGPVLTLDLAAASGVFGDDSAGVAYLVTQRTLAGTELDGSWTCSQKGELAGTASISATNLVFTDTASVQQTGTLYYDQIYNSEEENVPFKALVSLVTTPAADPNDEEAEAPEPRLSGVLLPMSSSVMLLSRFNRESSDLPAGICHRN